MFCLNVGFLSKISNFSVVLNWKLRLHLIPINFSGGYSYPSFLLVLSIDWRAVLVEWFWRKGLFSLSLSPPPPRSRSPLSRRSYNPYNPIYTTLPQGGPLTLSDTYISSYISLRADTIEIASDGWVRRHRVAAPVPWAGTEARSCRPSPLVYFDETEEKFPAVPLYKNCEGYWVKKLLTLV
jgi:hypothetical protein